MFSSPMTPKDENCNNNDDKKEPTEMLIESQANDNNKLDI